MTNRTVGFQFHSSPRSMSTSPRRKRKPQGAEDSPACSQQSPKRKRQHNLTPPTQSQTPPAAKTGSVNIHHNPEFLTAALRLPKKYHELAQMFDALDTACSLFHSRKQTLTFSRLLGSMELDGHRFTLGHLAQIVTICDSIQKNAFILERRIITSRDSPPEEQLVIIRNSLWEAESATKRRSDFYNQLLMITAAQHAKFLRDTGKQVPLKVEVWHSEWAVDDVEDIAEADLPLSTPSPPSSGSTTTTLSQVKANMHAEIEVDVDDLARPVPEQLTGISQDIIEKVRLRQQQQRADEAANPTADRHKRSIFSALPRLADVMRTIFVYEKGSIPLEALLTRLVSSLSNTVSRDDAHELLLEMSRTLPQWCQLITSPNNQKLTLVKLDRNMPFSEVKKLLKDKLAAHGL